MSFDEFAAYYERTVTQIAKYRRGQAEKKKRAEALEAQRLALAQQEEAARAAGGEEAAADVRAQWEGGCLEARARAFAHGAGYGSEGALFAARARAQWWEGKCSGWASSDALWAKNPYAATSTGPGGPFAGLSSAAAAF